MFYLWLMLTYLFGAIPWSVWLGKRFFSADPRDQPDRNPGAANAFRVGGWRLGAVVLLLDFCKAFLPVAIARWLLGLPGEQLFWLACMPSLGHAFSVFLGFRGGRGIVVMFGVWAGLTLYQAPLVLGLTAVLGLVLLKNDEYRALALPVVLIAYLLFTHAAGWMVLLAIAELLILALKIGIYLVRLHSQPPQSGQSGQSREQVHERRIGAQ
jgi:glycerol-3-phosphate acyltransferase PlsY